MKKEDVLRVGFAAAVVFTFALSEVDSLQAAFVLPDSGQTDCYDSDGTQISCFGNGQDGDYVGPQPAYQDNGDGTITDLNTGLMWMQDTNSSYYTYNGTEIYCNALTLAGYNDWRLPTLAERRTITHYGRANPALDTEKFLFQNYLTGEWVSDEQVNNTNYAWFVCNSNGRAYKAGKTSNYNNVCTGSNRNYRVRCVRTHQ